MNGGFINVNRKHVRLIFDRLFVRVFLANLPWSACALHRFAASPIAFISHERKRVVIQFLNSYEIQRRSVFSFINTSHDQNESDKTRWFTCPVSTAGIPYPVSLFCYCRDVNWWRRHSTTALTIWRMRLLDKIKQRNDERWTTILADLSVLHYAWWVEKYRYLL